MDKTTDLSGITPDKLAEMLRANNRRIEILWHSASEKLKLSGEHYAFLNEGGMPWLLMARCL